jgi:hypothetical protein
MCRVSRLFGEMLNFKGVSGGEGGGGWGARCVRLVVFVPGVDYLIIIGMMV